MSRAPTLRLVLGSPSGGVEGAAWSPLEQAALAGQTPGAVACGAHSELRAMGRAGLGIRVTAQRPVGPPVPLLHLGFLDCQARDSPGRTPAHVPAFSLVPSAVCVTPRVHEGPELTLERASAGRPGLGVGQVPGLAPEGRLGGPGYGHGRGPAGAVGLFPVL